MVWSWRLAIIAGVTPLVAGILTFIVWYITRAEWLMVTGIFIIYAGLGFFCLGLLSIGVFSYIAIKARVKRWVLKSALVIILLVSNFPVAFGLMSAAIYIVSVSVILVDNQSDHVVEKIMLFDPAGNSYSFGPVTARERRDVTFRFKGEGAVTYEMSVAGSAHSGTVFGYITSGTRNTATITVSKDGTVNAQEYF
jgi:hypothetical protein